MRLYRDIWQANFGIVTRGAYKRGGFRIESNERIIDIMIIVQKCIDKVMIQKCLSLLHYN